VEEKAAKRMEVWRVQRAEKLRREAVCELRTLEWFYQIEEAYEKRIERMRKDLGLSGNGDKWEQRWEGRQKEYNEIKQALEAEIAGDESGPRWRRMVRCCRNSFSSCDEEKKRRIKEWKAEEKELRRKWNEMRGKKWIEFRRDWFWGCGWEFSSHLV
jgi:hypothetical protein